MTSRHSFRLPEQLCGLLLWMMAAVGGAQRGNAQGLSVEITPLGNPVVNVVPGEPLTLAFLVSNTGTAPLSLRDSPTIPERWVVIPGPDFPLAPGERDTRLLTVLVPATIQAGRFQIGYRLRSTEGQMSPPSFVTVQLPVRQDLRITGRPLRPFIAAGDTLTTEFVVVNTGNSPVHLDLRGTSPAGGVKVFPSELRLAIQQRATVRASVQTSTRIRERARMFIELDAQVRRDNQAGLEPFSVQARAGGDLLPRAPRGLDYHHYPLSIGFTAGAQLSSDRDPGLMARVQVAGDGPLREMSKTRLSLLIDTPTRTAEQSLLFNRDQYRLELLNPRFEVKVGDVYQTTSRLTGGSAYGFGAAGQVKLRHVETGAYNLKQRHFVLDATRDAGAFVYLRPFGAAITGVSYLNREAPYLGGTAVGALVGWRPVRGSWSAEGEVGVGQNPEGQRSLGVNVRADATLLGRGYVGFEISQAGSTYPTYISNSTQAFVNASLKPHRDWMFNGNYHLFDYGPAGMAGMPRTVRTQNALLRGLYRTWSLRLSGQMLQGLRRPNTYTRYRGSATVGGARKVRTFNFNAEAEVGALVDADSNQVVPLYGGRIGVGWQHRGIALQSYVGYLWNGMGMTQQVGSAGNQLNVGLGLTAAVSPRLRLLVNSTVYYVTGDFSYAYANTRAGLRYELPWKHAVQLDGVHFLGSSQGVTSSRAEVAVTYQIPLRLRLQRSRQSGSVTGRLLDAATGRGLGNTAIFIGEKAAITDQNGTYYIGSVPQGATGVPQVVRNDMILLNAAPISVEGGRETTQDLMMTRAGGITVRVQARVMPEYDVAFLRRQDSTVVGVPGIELELSRGTQVVTAYTGSTGTAQFDDLVPGTYVLRLIPGSVPERYLPAAPTRTIVVVAGQQHRVTLPLQERSTRIRLQGIEEAPANRPDRVQRSTPQQGAHAPAAPVRQHRVRPGDTVFKLARLYYDDWRAWERILDANRTQITDPNVLEPGILLVIPPAQ